jgi:hypothetical protein
MYWRRTINQINVGKMLTAFFKLDERDIHSLKLNDKIRIDNSWWNINKVIDYNAGLNQLTKVELISVDTEIDLAPFQTASGNPAPSTTTSVALTSVMSSAMQTNNVILAGANVAIYGTRNMVAQNVRGMIIGDENTLNEDGLITPRINGVAMQATGYIANLTQTGTNAPEANVFTGQLVTWTRTAAGEYLGTPETPYDFSATYVMINNVEHDFLTSAYINTDGNVVVVTCKTSGHSHQDNVLNNTTLEIRTY